MDIKVSLDYIRADIIKYAKSDNVKLIAVTKTVGPDQVQALMDLGVRDFAENKAQMLEDKVKVLGHHENVNWHFIGHLQTNKVKKVLPLVGWIHSIDSVRLAAHVNLTALSLGKRPKLLLEVNVSGEQSKYGFMPQAVLDALPELNTLLGVDIVGLMTMAPLGASPQEISTIFNTLSQLGQTINLKKFDKIKITELSMGMSDDYPLALEAGATMIRIGSAIFK